MHFKLKSIYSEFLITVIHPVFITVLPICTYTEKKYNGKNNTALLFMYCIVEYLKNIREQFIQIISNNYKTFSTLHSLVKANTF